MESKAAKEEMRTPEGVPPKIIYLTDEARAQKTATCPYCGEEVPSDAKKCNHCNRVIEVIEPAEKTSETATDTFDSLGYIKSALASRYEVLQEISRSETYTIFRAIHIHLGKEVALKVLLRSAAQDHDFTEKFHQRARAVDKLSQSNIIRIYDEGVESGVHYMAMESLKGTDLQKKIAEHGHLSPDELISILMPTVNALGHAHRNGIVHGNIKSSSIFLHKDGRIILSSFGNPRSSKGTQLSFDRDMKYVEYLSPEEASGKGADPRSDIYSLGVVMYLALTGKFPYIGTNTAATITAIISNKYTPISELRQVPQWIENIVNKCLQKEALRRVQNCAELLSLLNGKPITQSAPPPKVEQPQKDIQPVEPPKARTVDVEPKVVKASTPPAVEPPKAKTTLTDQPIVRLPVIEEPPKETFKSTQTTPKSEPIKPQPLEKQPAKVGTKSEQLPKFEEETIVKPRTKESERLVQEQVEVKKGRGTLWIGAVGVVAVIGIVVTLLMINKSKTNESTAPNAASTQVAPASEQNIQPPVNQVNVSKEVQSTGQNLKQGESSSPASQVEASPQPTVVPKSTASNKEPAKTPAQTQPVVSFVSVPDLTGTQLGVAKSILSLNGLKLGEISTIPDPSNDGMVIRQVPKAGTQLKKGSTINLIVGSR